MYLALSVQVGGCPKCSPLQKRKPIATHHVGAAGERLLERAANRQRMLLGHDALAGAARVDRNVGQLDELAHLGAGLRPEHAVAACDQRTLGRHQHLERAIDLRGIAGRADVVHRELARALALPRVFFVVIENVLRNLEQRDALRRRDSLAERGAQVELNRGPIGHALGELGEAIDDFGAVGLLERAEMILGVGMLARDADDGAVGQSGDAEAGHRVGQAASGGDHAYADFAGGARVGVGGVGGGLLVAHVDQLDVVIAQLAEDGEQMAAVDRETILHTILAHHARD